MPLESDADVEQMKAVQDRDGNRRPPANDDTLSSELSREIATWSAGTVPIEDSDGTAIDPATEQSVVQVGDKLANFASGIDDEATDDGTGSTLPSHSIPDGVEVVVQAKYDNNDRIKVGLTASPTVELKSGQSATYRVQNTDQINIVAKSAGDGVNISAEVTA